MARSVTVAVWRCPVEECERSQRFIALDGENPVRRGVVGLKMHLTHSGKPGHGLRGESARALGYADADLREYIDVI